LQSINDLDELGIENALRKEGIDVKIGAKQKKVIGLLFKTNSIFFKIE